MIEIDELIDALIEFNSTRPSIKDKSGIELKNMDEEGNTDYNVMIDFVEVDGKWYMEL